MLLTPALYLTPAQVWSEQATQARLMDDTSAHLCQKTTGETHTAELFIIH